MAKSPGPELAIEGSGLSQAFLSYLDFLSGGKDFGSLFADDDDLLRRLLENGRRLDAQDASLDVGDDDARPRQLVRLSTDVAKACNWKINR